MPLTFLEINNLLSEIELPCSGELQIQCEKSGISPDIVEVLIERFQGYEEIGELIDESDFVELEHDCSTDYFNADEY